MNGCSVLVFMWGFGGRGVMEFFDYVGKFGNVFELVIY